MNNRSARPVIMISLSGGLREPGVMLTEKLRPPELIGV